MVGRFYAATSVAGISAILAWADPSHAQGDLPLWGHPMIGLQAAHERGFTGAGVTVGIMDAGIQVDHREFATRWMGGMNTDGSPYGPESTHGTHVAGIAGGTNVGVAPGISIYGMDWSADPSNAGFASGYRWGLAQGVRIFNNSWETAVLDPSTGERRTETVDDKTFAQVDAEWREMLDGWRDTIAAGSVQVFSTGNSELLQPSLASGLPLYFPEFKDSWIAVTAVAPGGEIASYANHCGVAAAWCMAAPGGDGPNGLPDAIWSSWPGGGYEGISGTSMASPHATGAVAIAAQIFPEASMPDLAQLVLQTATDIGAPGIDPVYGWGLLNVANMVETIDPGTAGLYANAAWSRFAMLGHAGSAIRQRLSLRGGIDDVAGTGFDLLGYAAANGAGMRGGVQIAEPAVPGFWVMPVYGTASIGAGPSSHGSAATTAGIMVGADILNETTRQFGIAAAYTGTRLTSPSVADRSDADALHLAIYGALRSEGWFAEGTGQAAFFNQMLTRHEIGGAAGTSGNPVGQSTLGGTGFEIDARAGRDIALENGMTLSPHVALTARWQAVNAARETGAGIFGLTLPATQYGQVDVGPGLRWASAPMAMGASTVRIAADITYARSLGDTDHGTETLLLGRRIEGRTAAIGRDVLRIGAQIDVAADGGRVGGFAGYGGSFRQRAASHTLAAGVRVNF